MNHLIFTAVLTACLRIVGYQQGPAAFGPSPEGLDQIYYKDPDQLNSLYASFWPPLMSSYSTISFAAYTSTYYVLKYFARSFGRYNTHTKVFQWLMTIYPIVTALTGFQFTNLLLFLLQKTKQQIQDENINMGGPNGLAQQLSVSQCKSLGHIPSSETHLITFFGG
ncbi:hypothetical protein DSO57_1028003 [Entomophthora muscae]|uniref:Uncharacterized protein n=1 Tax=Entomophthora muscae TaxID=34485 RepID=A0ACC2TP42_9FUNG|nr:hypothetical protein DSO57_1028003 [Entomophthora muscae]